VLASPTRLAGGDRPAALAHFLRLSEADRQMRFLQVMPDQAIDAYVTQIDFSKAICFGMFDAEERLVAFAEAIPYRAGTRLLAEAAFSTDAGWRRNGLARRLCDSLGEHARSVGIDRVVLHCHRRNAPMRGLLRAIDAVTSFDEGDLEAEWDPTQ
jgi:RimJ/RimL family protein N-acetyltransferase